MTRPVRWSWSLALGVGAAAVSVLATLAPHHVRAGERDLEVVTVRADDGSDPGSDNCFAGVRRGLRRIREVRLQNLTREVAERRLGGYSKGMLQRIGLAQALVQNPRLVILDEPTAGVDPIGSRQIRDLILRLRDEGYTVFLCSHLLEQVQEVCDRVGILFRGRMRREGSLDELIAIEGQTTLTLDGASPDLISRIRTLVASESGAAVVDEGHPRTSLEQLFIHIAERSREESK